MGYLSLYKTLSEHGADNSRLTPNISLITDENRLILTTKNNLNMTFNNINVVETADEMTNNIILQNKERQNYFCLSLSIYLFTLFSRISKCVII